MCRPMKLIVNSFSPGRITMKKEARKITSPILKRLNGNEDYFFRYQRIKEISTKVRVSEYLITNACNIRCKGCWFFEYGFEKQTKDVNDLEKLRTFLRSERDRGINTSLIIGGEPTLHPKRLGVFGEVMQFNSISTNGLKPLSLTDFPDFSVLISLFGGGSLDDELRAIRPNGKRFSDIFQTSLDNYRHDPRAHFIFAVTEDGIQYIEETVQRIADNGNTVSVNFYSKYGTDHPLRSLHSSRLMNEILRVRNLYPSTLCSHPYYIKAMVTGKSHWGEFGYDACPSLSVDHPDNAARISNGNPILPGFNAYAADLETINLCCTSGHCEDCRDSQAVMSWIMINQKQFVRDANLLKTWIEIAESYWHQFVWAHDFRNSTPSLMAHNGLDCIMTT